jgi:hypothetical protein
MCAFITELFILSHFLYVCLYITITLGVCVCVCVETGSQYVVQADSNSQFSCLSLPSGGITGMCRHA